MHQGVRHTGEASRSKILRVGLAPAEGRPQEVSTVKLRKGKDEHVEQPKPVNQVSPTSHATCRPATQQRQRRSLHRGLTPRHSTIRIIR